MKIIILLAISLLIIIAVNITPNAGLYTTITPKLITKSYGAQYVANSYTEVKNSHIYIDELYKLQQVTHFLVTNLYLPPYPSYQSFIKITRNLNKTITPTCLYFDELVSTTGKLKSRFKQDAIHCKNSLEGMPVVLLDLQQGKYSHIQLEHQKISIINNHLLNKLDGYEDSYVLN